MHFDATANPPFGELAAAYGRGVLTPFTGAGISRPTCPSWEEMIAGLEVAAGFDLGTGRSDADLIRRASRAVRALRHRGADALGLEISRIMYGRDAGGGVPPIPEATAALSEIWWPLVLTTNYEALFLEAWNRWWVYEKQPRPDPLPDSAAMAVVGRGRDDCQRVLNSTRRPDNPLLWALQGFIGPPQSRHPLASQLAIGHEEYRRQTHEAVHFRRAFAEIYRSRSLLFVGSGLRDSYLLDLFGEALELLGTIGHFHYALVPKGEVDRDFLKRRLQILAIEYTPEPGVEGAHGRCVAAFLRQLRKVLNGPRPRPSLWSLKLDAAGRVQPEDSRPDVAVVRGKLELPRRPGIAVAVSAGLGGRNLLIGATGTRLVQKLGFDPDPRSLPLERIGESHVYRLLGHPFFVVAARDDERAGRDARDARHVAPATQELMEIAADDGFTRVDTMLLASGRQRTFPQYVSLHEMVRGFCRWRAGAEAATLTPPTIRIHTVDPALLALMETGRIDLNTMLDSPHLQFWIVIQLDSGSQAPALSIAGASSTVEQLMEEYAIPGAGWTVGLRPAPTRHHVARPVEELTGSSSPTLSEFGVLNGSTIVFLRNNRDD